MWTSYISNRVFSFPDNDHIEGYFVKKGSRKNPYKSFLCHYEYNIKTRKTEYCIVCDKKYIDLVIKDFVYRDWNVTKDNISIDTILRPINKKKKIKL